MKIIYAPDRFIMSKLFKTDDLDIITDSQKLTDFVKSIVNNELKPYWETTPVPRVKYSQKVVGEDFDKRVLHNKKDAIVLVYHP